MQIRYQIPHVWPILILRFFGVSKTGCNYAPFSAKTVPQIAPYASHSALSKMCRITFFAQNVEVRHPFFDVQKRKNRAKMGKNRHFWVQKIVKKRVFKLAK